MIVFFQLLLGSLFSLPKALYFWLRDFYFSVKEKWGSQFDKWGLHVFVGEFGAGKTSTMVYKAYRLAKRYPQLSILTNLQLKHFPKGTKILPLVNFKSIEECPNNCLVLIDEIGTIFNSRDFMKGSSLPKSLFQHLCQCRKRHVMVYGTTQRWNFLDKQLRDIVASVYSSHLIFWHPFSRLAVVRRYDAQEYDTGFSNPLYPLVALSAEVYVQTDAVRNLYSTDQLIVNMLNDSYLSDEEIAASRGDTPVFATDFDVKHVRKAKRKRRYGF